MSSASHEDPAPAPLAPPLAPPPQGRWTIVSPTSTLMVLTLINFFNYVDRQVLTPLIPLLKLPASEGGLGLSDTEAGMLHTAFMVVHSVAAIPLGILADRWMRPRVIAAGVGLWSVATAAAGLAHSYAQLFVARAAVGIGEAAYAPAASALISDRFPPAQRARALGVFQLGMLVGTAVGIVAGGVVAAAFGWRSAFFIVGLPGLILTVLALMIWDRGPHERRRPGATATAVAQAGSLSLRAATPGVRPALVLINATGILITFFVGAVSLWGIEFLVRYHFDGDTERLGEATLMFGIVGTIAGITGAITGSSVSDRIERRSPGAGRMLTIAVGVLVGTPFAVLAITVTNLWVALAALALAVFFVSWYVGPVMAAVHDVVSPDRRATATGAYLFLVHALGDGISPGIVGIIADATSLRGGLVVAIIPMGLAGLTALLAIRYTRQVAASKLPGAASA